ncbi:2-oxoglutarate and iron-dependent oxygenase domain-containing protein [Nocardia abscessus]|uniref:2-oxoglutarate and iron-dependent oxygenase domain-containing protein n=1 Tax=Nocardia abscessus TaxID=120957 RepID=UPI00245605EB|nr:2-oxoglutarate and iron-dependent oxygenase domain-containing protein [Nocardia abscessus]
MRSRALWRGIPRDSGSCARSSRSRRRRLRSGAVPLDLLSATHETGFFYLIGHGVAADRSNEVVAVARHFFALPPPRRSRSVS